MTDRVGVTAIVTFPEKNYEKALAVFKKHLPMLRAYDGCERFVVYCDIKKPGVFTINEEWKTHSQLDTHLKDKAITSIFAEIEALGGEINNIFTRDINTI